MNNISGDLEYRSIRRRVPKVFSIVEKDCEKYNELVCWIQEEGKELNCEDGKISIIVANTIDPVLSGSADVMPEACSAGQIRHFSRVLSSLGSTLSAFLSLPRFQETRNRHPNQGAA